MDICRTRLWYVKPAVNSEVVSGLLWNVHNSSSGCPAPLALSLCNLGSLGQQALWDTQTNMFYILYMWDVWTTYVKLLIKYLQGRATALL